MGTSTSLLIILAKYSSQARSQATEQERIKVNFKFKKEASLTCAEMELVRGRRGFEEEASSHQQRSNERGIGVVEPPAPAIGGDGDRNERQRRNGIAGAPFLQGFLTSKHHQTDDSRSR